MLLNRIYTEIEMKSKKETTILLNGKPFTVPPGGSLGVFALGAVGVRAWRKAKKEWEQSEENGEKTGKA